MATYIEKTEYLAIADLYTEAVRPLAGLADYYADASEVILRYDESKTYDQSLYVELDLLRPFTNAYLSAVAGYGDGVTPVYPGNAVEAVRSLQRHVLSRSGEATINDWYDEVTIDPVRELSDEFKAMSEQAGYPIT